MTAGGADMRCRLGLLTAVLMSGFLAGCLDPEGLSASAPDGQQQSLVDPDAANVPPVTDELGRAKQSFHNRNFGLAEKQFRAVVENAPQEIEAWLGLAATHDQLGRFDLADREYAQVARRAGTGLELLNNRGMSYMMRGDLIRARKDFSAAKRLDPDNEFLNNNLRELSAKSAGRS